MNRDFYLYSRAECPQTYSYCMHSAATNSI